LPIKEKPKLLFYDWLIDWFMHACMHMVVGLELRAYTLSHSTSPFIEGFFEIESLELFSWAGFKLRSSWSLPPE
jgi:hypothetical protein